MKNELHSEKEFSYVKKRFFSWKIVKQKINSKDQIFKIVLTGILLALATLFSLIEISPAIMGAKVPLRVFDALIMAIAIPIIGVWYTLIIAIIEPWLHFALDSDHPPIQMFFDNLANIIFVLSFVLTFYKLFKLRKPDYNKKTLLVKNTFAGLFLVPFNAIISSLIFVFTIIILANTNLSKPTEYVAAITSFYQNYWSIFFILLAIELARFLFIYILFALVQKKLSKMNRFQLNNY